jgi:2-aminoadipate transaminase
VDPIVEELQRRAASDARVIALGGGLPSPRQFPRRALATAFLRTIGDPSALQYGWPEGHERLRAFIAARLAARGARVDPDEVVVTSGAQQAIVIAAQTVVAPGARVATDEESYPAALDAFRTLGAIPVAGLDAPATTAAYVMPAIANPRGRGLDRDARARLVASRRAILEDDAYAELRFDGAAPPPLLAEARGRVFHIGTFSKTLCPRLRVGWLIAPRRHQRRVLRAKRDQDLQSSTLAQAILVEALGIGARGAEPAIARAVERFDARLARLRPFYRRRAERLVRALRRHLPSWRATMPEGGFSVWVESDDDLVDDVTLLRAAVEEGVAFDPGRLFRPGRGPAPLGLRVCFSAEPPERLEEGVRRLARAFTRVAREGAARNTS